MLITTDSASKRSLAGWWTSGEPWIWLNAAAVGISITAVVALLLLIAIKGFAHFWPADVAQINYTELTAQGAQPRVTYGEIVEEDSIPLQQYLESGGDASVITPDQENVTRWLVKTGNRRINPPDFRWIVENQIQQRTEPAGLTVIERLEWGNAYGQPIRLTRQNNLVVEGDAVWPALQEDFARAEDVRGQIEELEQGVLNTLNYELEGLRLDRRRAELDNRPDRLPEIDGEVANIRAEYALEEARLRELYTALAGQTLTLQTATGTEIEVPLAEILRSWQPNDMSTGAKLTHYLSSIWRFLSEDPREANTEGGIFPAIFGTVLMVLLMSVLVTPFGVMAALYLREYARQGPLVRLIRIAVNNLAGVPSIVYGVFGLGFFVYFLGGNLDQLFFAESLPSPTFGTPGLVWASLTLALLTVPVVIVSTEEGLSRIPRSLREGSLALGATKAETLVKVVLPMASPSILTGVILAVARAAGEVAPLMLVGVVKLAPTLPLDGNFPYLHLERKFMHLGFHIYDVGFQSPNVEAARPLVYATALLLVIIIVVLNLTAITLRGRLERRYRGVES